MSILTVETFKNLIAGKKIIKNNLLGRSEPGSEAEFKYM
jgi:hypothetical protein